MGPEHLPLPGSGVARPEPTYATKAAWVISKEGTDFTPWSAFKSGSYLQHKGKDYTLVAGHPRAGEWSN